MSWSYDTTLTADLDKVRFYIGDTNSDEPLLSNEEIEFLVSSEGSARAAAIAGAEMIASKFARFADSAVGDLSISYSQRHAQYLAVAARLRRSLTLSVAPLVGGISNSRKETVEDDTDRVEPAFTVGMLSHPDTVRSTSDREQP